MGIVNFFDGRAARGAMSDFVVKSGAYRNAVWGLKDSIHRTEENVVTPSAQVCADALVSQLTTDQIWAVLRGTTSANSHPMLRLVPPAQNGSGIWEVLLCNANPNVNMIFPFEVPYYMLVEKGISDLRDHGVTPMSPESYAEVLVRSQKPYDGCGPIDRQGFVLLDDGTPRGVDPNNPLTDTRLYGHGIYGRPHIVEGAKNLGYFSVGMRCQVGVTIPN